MRHLCKNFIENGTCTKCRTPEWAIYFPEFEHKIGSKVRLPKEHPYSGDKEHPYSDGKEFFVVDFYKIGYILGTKKGVPSVKWFEWWELYPIKSQEED